MSKTRPRFFGSNRFLFFKALAFVTICIVGWLLINVRNLQQFLDTYEARNREQEEIELLEQRIRTLEKQQRSLQMNGFEKERQVRERLGMHYPGEKVIFLRTDPVTANDTTSSRPQVTSGTLASE
jgi:cell division protein FtsB